MPLSLGQSLVDGDLSGRRVHVKVLFGRTNWTVHVHPTRRRARAVTLWRTMEERAAAAKFGYRLSVEGFEEVILRRGTLDSEEFRSAQDPHDDPTYLPILARLRTLSTQYPEIWLPAGIGGHVDHRVIAAAGAELALRPGKGPHKVAFYEDRPYVSYLTDSDIGEELSVLGLDLSCREVSPRIQGSTQRTVRSIYRSQIVPYFAEAQQKDLDQERCERIWVPQSAMRHSGLQQVTHG